MEHVQVCPNLLKSLSNLLSETVVVNESFRLWISAEPSSPLPPGILLDSARFFLDTPLVLVFLQVAVKLFTTCSFMVVVNVGYEISRHKISVMDSKGATEMESSSGMANSVTQHLCTSQCSTIPYKYQGDWI